MSTKYIHKNKKQLTPKILWLVMLCYHTKLVILANKTAGA